MMHKSCDHAGRFMLCNVIKTMSFRMAPGTVLSVNFLLRYFQSRLLKIKADRENRPRCHIVMPLGPFLYERHGLDDV